MMKKKPSSKDMAFEKERAKFRQRIRELEYETKQAKIAEYEAKAALKEKESEIEQLNDHIERLLEYTELSKEDLVILLESEKRKAEFAHLYGSMVRVF